MLGSEGWQATTVSRVCERARLTPRYFYESYADRDELLVAIFDGIIDDITREIVKAHPADADSFLRATVAAFVDLVTHDPARARAAFVEAFGNEALMKRRFEQMHWFAAQLADQARGKRRLGRHQQRRLHTACLVASGGLIEMIVAWLAGELDSNPGQLADDYTTAASAAVRAAMGD